VLSCAEGKEHHAAWAEPEGVIGGRIELFIVPLPSTASLKVPIHISKSTLGHAFGQREDFEPEPTKRYTLQAQFTGEGVILAAVDPDSHEVTIGPK
jgi:hypothetical protein